MTFHHRTANAPLTVQLLCIFLLLLIPMQMFGMCIFHSSNVSMKLAVEQSAQANMNFLLEAFQDEVIAVNKQMEQLLFFQDLEIREFVVLEGQLTNTQYWIHLQNIVNKLKLVQYGNMLIEDLELYYPKLKLYISASDGIYGLDQDTFAGIEEACQAGTNKLLLRDKVGLFVGKSYPSTALTHNETPDIILLARIGKSAMRDYFASMTSMNQYSMALVDWNRQDVLLSMYGAPSDAEILLAANGNYKDRQNRILVQHSGMLDLMLVQFIPLNAMFAKARRLTLWLLIYMLSCLPVVLVYCGMIHRVVRKPIRQLLDGFHEVQEGNLAVQLYPMPQSDELSLLFRHFNTMVAKLDSLINQVYRQELYAKQIELKQLQAQIDPHFLYNSFFILKHLIKDENNVAASELAGYLSEYFQYITRNNAQETMLKQEIHHGCLYLDIQKIRFGNRLRTDLQSLPQKYETLLVPRLILQPILENSVKYGLPGKNGQIHLRFQECSEMLIIFVEDNGTQLSDVSLEKMRLSLEEDQPTSEITALINIHRRLRLRYGSVAGIELSRSEMGGLCVALKIAFHKNGGETNA